MLYSVVGAKVPGSESSTPGTFAPGSEWSWERKVQFPYRGTNAYNRFSTLLIADNSQNQCVCLPDISISEYAQYSQIYQPPCSKRRLNEWMKKTIHCYGSGKSKRRLHTVNIYSYSKLFFFRTLLSILCCKVTTSQQHI